MNKKVNTSWGNVADWYGEMLADENSYQQKVILPNLLRLMQIKKSETILDVGCGTGFFSRAFAEAGAKVIGVDVGGELIAKAREGIMNYELGIKGQRPTYHVAAAEKMTMIQDESADKAVMVLSLQNIENATGALAEATRVLKKSAHSISSGRLEPVSKGGKLFIVLNHPAFRVPQASSSDYDAEKKVQYRRLDSYMSERRVAIDMHPGKRRDPSTRRASGFAQDDTADGSVTWSFHRPLQYYFKLFAKNNLAVSRLEEWTSHTKTPHGPRAEAENRARAEFPLFLCIECLKLS